jgi:hypothetical protein
MSAVCHHAPGPEHHVEVRREEARRVRDDEVREAFGCSLDRAQDILRGRGGQPCLGLVEHAHPRATEDHPDEDEAPRLAAREVRRLAADHGVEATGPFRRRELVEPDRRERRSHLRIGRRRVEAEREVFANGALERLRALPKHAEDRRELGGVELSNVDAVDEDPALVGLVEAQEEADERRLSRAGRAASTDRHTCRNSIADSVEERRRGARRRVPHPVELELAPRGLLEPTGG